jgi:hypothetical protein
MSNISISLSQFSKRTGIGKSTVYNDCRRLGFDTSQGLTDEAVDALLSLYGLSELPELQQPTPAPVEPDAPAEPAGQLQVIQPGENHLAPPEAPASFDLSTFGLNTLDTFEDPLAVAQRAIAAMDALQQGMNSHIESLEQRRKQTAQAVTSIKSKQEELKLTTLRAQILEQVTTQQITEGQQQLTEALGKQSAAA